MGMLYWVLALHVYCPAGQPGRSRRTDWGKQNYQRSGLVTRMRVIRLGARSYPRPLDWGPHYA